MSVRVRLTRVGSKKNPIWRVVVTDQRSPRDGRFIETIGHYNPQTEPSTITLDTERLDHWVARGAQPSNTVKKLAKAYAKGPAPVAEAEPASGAAAVEVVPAEVAAPADAAPEGATAGEATAAPAEPEAAAEPEATAEPAAADAAPDPAEDAGAAEAEPASDAEPQPEDDSAA
jgi:small subunit ribosomal protein S16